MAKHVAELLQDAFIDHGVRVMRVQESLVKQVDTIVTKLHRELANTVKIVDPTSEAGVRVLEKRSSKLITKAYTEIAVLSEKELAKLPELEARHTRLAISQALELALEDEL